MGNRSLHIPLLVFLLLFCSTMPCVKAQNDSIQTLITDTLTKYSSSDTRSAENSDNVVDKKDRWQEYKDYIVHSVKRSPNSESESQKKKEEPEYEFQVYQGRVIRDIRFQQLEVFGQDVNDTTKMPDHWSERLGNGLHVNTLEYVLRNRLLIKKNDRLDAYTLLENERMYRQLAFIGDSRVVVQPIGADSVDVTFIVKDVIPMSGSLEIFDVVYGRGSINTKSILGLGHEVYYDNKWNGNRAPYYGHKIRYKIPNISNTFFAIDGSYENTWNKEALKVSLSRRFYSARTKYAGGIAFDQVNSYMNIDFPKDTHDSIEVDYNFYDMWIGRSLNLKFLSSYERKTNITLTTRFYRYEFFKQPEVAEALLHSFHERDMYLAGLSISSHGYQKSSLIYAFGRTEDVPYGFALSGVIGFEKSQFQDRPYMGGTFSHATKLTRFGYLYHKAQFGTYVDEEPEQGHLYLELNYFTPLANPLGRYKYRVFANLEYQSGYNRYKDEFLKFTSRDGIRGLSNSSFRGNERLNLNLDINCYSPHYLMGFRMIYYTFLDAGIISNDYSKLFRNQLYSGFGIGVKARNENLIFDTFLIQFGYYPAIPDGTNPEYVRLTAVGYQRFNQFVVERPEALDYTRRY